MRLILLARCRSTGRVRLLTEHAFDSKAAAVDAAEVTARAMDLSGDEVLAVDLESADPVLVLRIGAGGSVSRPEWTTSETPVAERNSQAAAELRAALAAFAPPSPPPIRPQPSFPLFGPTDDESVSDESADEDLAATLSRVARRMEADLAAAVVDVSDRVDEDWDARTFDDYTLPSDGRSRSAREEGYARMGAADCAEAHEADGMGDARVDARLEPLSDHWGDAAPSEVEDTAVGTSDDRGARAYAWWAPRDHGPDDAAPAVERNAAAPAELGSHDIPAIDCDVSDEWPAMAPTDADPDADRVEAPVVEWEPSPVLYRPVATDFAVWVCADCVYQRTCRKAGTATPANCGNFQWRAR